MILNETYTLANGIEIPKLGLGTWFIEDDKAADAVKAAVQVGSHLTAVRMKNLAMKMYLQDILQSLLRSIQK